MPTSESITGRITVSLIGSIRSHLKGLLGYDTMILELMQNADDAKAEEMVFDIRDESLRVTNSAEFTYCGHLEDKCSDDKKCDFHGIIEFAGGHKELNSENIGRFGIGFSSVYQITDRPTITSNGISLELIPENAEYRRNNVNKQNTTIELPWATNSDTELRQELGLSYINQENIEELFEVCKSVFNQSLLFLRYLNRIDLKRNGKSSLIVKLNRKQSAGKNKLSISFEPRNRAVEEWLVFDYECAVAKIDELKNEYPLLVRDKRKSDIQIAVKTDSIPIEKGLLYAYLPTQQSSFLPLHINADFYPDPSRKSINLSGGQHQQKWNELLITTAAEVIASELEKMTEYINHKHLFELFLNSYKANKNEYFPFTTFWDHIKKKIKEGAKVIYSSIDKYEKFEDIVFDKNLDERKENELSAFYKVGGKLLHDDYLQNRSSHLSIDVLKELGVKPLTVDKFGDIVNESNLLNSYRTDGNNAPTDNKIKEIFVPLWSYADALISSENPDGSYVEPIDFALTVFNHMTSIGDLYRAPTSIKNTKLGKLLQLESDGKSSDGLMLANDKLSKFGALYDYVKPFSLYTLVSYLERRVEANDSIFNTKTPPEEIKKIYGLIVELYDDYDIYPLEDLKLLPIWKTSTNVFSELDQILLPGNFEDPIGDGQTLDSNCLSSKVEKFIEEKLEVKRQTIEAYIETYIPIYFSDEGWTEETETYQMLMLTFANHKKLLKDEKTFNLLKKTPLIPNRSGGWSTPSAVYFYDEKLVKLIGNYDYLWIDEEKLLKDKSIKKFIKDLGVSTTPSPQILMERIVKLSENHLPTNDVVEKSSNAFYKLCELYVKDEDSDGTSMREVITECAEELLDGDCFPVLNDNEEWHSPVDEYLYNPSQYKAIEHSDALILAYTSSKKLKGCEDLLNSIGIQLEIDFDDVMVHFRRCLEKNESVDNLVYEVLNNQINNIIKTNPSRYYLTKEYRALNEMENEPCIYLPEQKRYARPNQTFFENVPFNKFTYSVPSKYEKFEPLFQAMGVKDEPTVDNYISIILEDLVQHYVHDSEQEETPSKGLVSKEDKKIYSSCVNFISEHFEFNEDDDLHQELYQQPSILTRIGRFNNIDDVLIDDSEWYKGFFDTNNDEIDWLTGLTDINWSVFEEMGLKRLSNNVTLVLSSKNGEEQQENNICKIIQDRRGLFVRVLDKRPKTIITKLLLYIDELSVVSFDQIKIIARVDNNRGLTYSTKPRSEEAYFNESEKILILSRPLDKNRFVSILKPLLYTLLPDSDDTEIRSTLMAFDAICTKEIDAAAAYLDSLNYAKAEDIEIEEEPIEEHLGKNEVLVDEPDDATQEVDKAIEELKGDDSHTDENAVEIDEVEDEVTEEEDESEVDTLESVLSKSDEIDMDSKVPIKVDGEKSEVTMKELVENFEKNKSESKKGDKARTTSLTPPQKIKSGDSKKIDKDESRRLVSYVVREPTEPLSEKDNEHRMKIEEKSIEIVLRKEKESGRKPETQPPNNPGYDIYSKDEKSGEERFIEVKGTTKEWGKKGVSISISQFLFSLEKKENSWLYVVDNVFGPSPETYKLQNFAQQVDSFMFDKGWAGIMEIDDKKSKYVVGKTIIDKVDGKGVIEDVEIRGKTSILKIKFENSDTKRKPLNTERMTIEEEK